MAPIRKFVFVSQRPDRPSEIMLGTRLVSTLRRLKIEAVQVKSDSLDPAALKNTALYFVKTVPPQIGYRLAERRNLIVLNLTDSMAANALDEVSCKDAVHAVIYPNARAMTDFRQYFPKSFVHEAIPHFWDDRFRPNTATQFKLAFVGTNVVVNRELHLQRIPGLYHVPIDRNLFDEARNYSCHYSVRCPDTLSALYKPQSKLLTAAACNANIIASRDAGFLDILPDYPYYTEPSLDKTLAAVELARSTYANRTWAEGLELLSGLKTRYGPEAFARRVLGVLEQGLSYLSAD